MNKKTSDILKGIVLGAVILVVCICIAYFTLKPTTSVTTPMATTIVTTTPASTTTPTTEATPTPVEGKPKKIPTTVDLPEPGGDWIPEKVDKTWVESSIEKWGERDIGDNGYSYYVSPVYEDPNGVYFRLYHFRVYVYEGGYWTRSEVFPVFEGKIVMGEGPRFLVLDEESVEVWEVDYSPDSGTWNFYRLFAVKMTEPESIRVFGDWDFETTQSKAYIASNKTEEVWTVSKSGITSRSYDDVLFSNEEILIVDKTHLIRVAYKTDFRFETGSGFSSVNESTLEGGSTLLEIGDSIFDPIKATGGAIYEQGGEVYVQESIGRIILS